MADEVYIEFASEQTLLKEDGTVIGTGKFRVDLAPIGSLEDSSTKNIDIEPIPRYPHDQKNPVVAIHDTKTSMRKVTITGILTDLTEFGGLSVEERADRVLYLYGEKGRPYSTKLTFVNLGNSYPCFMTRETLTRAGGENFYEYIIELTLGKPYNEAI